jgi:hypothetical protein
MLKVIFGPYRFGVDVVFANQLLYISVYHLNCNDIQKDCKT